MNLEDGTIVVMCSCASQRVSVLMVCGRVDVCSSGMRGAWLVFKVCKCSRGEINNGRIAMFAAIGQIAAGLYTGKSGIEQFGL